MDPVNEAIAVFVNKLQEGNCIHFEKLFKQLLNSCRQSIKKYFSSYTVSQQLKFFRNRPHLFYLNAGYVSRNKNSDTSPCDAIAEISPSLGESSKEIHLKLSSALTFLLKCFNSLYYLESKRLLSYVFEDIAKHLYQLTPIEQDNLIRNLPNVKFDHSVSLSLIRSHKGTTKHITKDEKFVLVVVWNLSTFGHTHFQKLADEAQEISPFEFSPVLSNKPVSWLFRYFKKFEHYFKVQNSGYVELYDEFFTGDCEYEKAITGDFTVTTLSAAECFSVCDNVKRPFNESSDAESSNKILCKIKKDISTCSDVKKKRSSYQYIEADANEHEQCAIKGIQSKGDALYDKFSMAVAYLLSCFGYLHYAELATYVPYILKDVRTLCDLSIPQRKEMFRNIPKTEIDRNGVLHLTEPCQLQISTITNDEILLLFTVCYVGVFGDTHFGKLVNEFIKCSPRGIGAVLSSKSTAQQFKYFKSYSKYCKIDGDGFITLPNSLMFSRYDTENEDVTLLNLCREGKFPSHYVEELSAPESSFLEPDVSKAAKEAYSNPALEENNIDYEICQRIRYSITFLLMHFEVKSTPLLWRTILHVFSDAKTYFFCLSIREQMDFIVRIYHPFFINTNGIVYHKSPGYINKVLLKEKTKHLLYFSYLLSSCEKMHFLKLFDDLEKHTKLSLYFKPSVSDKFEYFKKHGSVFFISDNGYVKLLSLPEIQLKSQFFANIKGFDNTCILSSYLNNSSKPTRRTSNVKFQVSTDVSEKKFSKVESCELLNSNSVSHDETLGSKGTLISPAHDLTSSCRVEIIEWNPKFENNVFGHLKDLDHCESNSEPFMFGSFDRCENSELKDEVSEPEFRKSTAECKTYEAEVSKLLHPGTITSSTDVISESKYDALENSLCEFENADFCKTAVFVACKIEESEDVHRAKLVSSCGDDSSESCLGGEENRGSATGRSSCNAEAAKSSREGCTVFKYGVRGNGVVTGCAKFKSKVVEKKILEDEMSQKIAHSIVYLLNYFEVNSTPQLFCMILHVFCNVKTYFLTFPISEQVNFIRKSYLPFSIDGSGNLSLSDLVYNEINLNLNDQEKQLLFFSYLLCKTEKMHFLKLFGDFSKQVRNVPVSKLTRTEKFWYFRKVGNIFSISSNEEVELLPLPKLQLKSTFFSNMYSDENFSLIETSKTNKRSKSKGKGQKNKAASESTSLTKTGTNVESSKDTGSTKSCEINPTFNVKNSATDKSDNEIKTSASPVFQNNNSFNKSMECNFESSSLEAEQPASDIVTEICDLPNLRQKTTEYNNHFVKNEISDQHPHNLEVEPQMKNSQKDENPNDISSLCNGNLLEFSNSTIINSNIEEIHNAVGQNSNNKNAKQNGHISEDSTFLNHMDQCSAISKERSVLKCDTNLSSSLQNLRCTKVLSLSEDQCAIVERIKNAIYYLIQYFEVEVKSSFLEVTFHVLNVTKDYFNMPIHSRLELLKQSFLPFCVNDRNVLYFNPSKVLQGMHLDENEKNWLFISFVLSQTGEIHYNEVFKKFAEHSKDLPENVLTDADKFFYFVMLDDLFDVTEDGLLRLLDLPTLNIDLTPLLYSFDSADHADSSLVMVSDETISFDPTKDMQPDKHVCSDAIAHKKSFRLAIGNVKSASNMGSATKAVIKPTGQQICSEPNLHKTNGKMNFIKKCSNVPNDDRIDSARLKSPVSKVTFQKPMKKTSIDPSLIDKLKGINFINVINSHMQKNETVNTKHSENVITLKPENILSNCGIRQTEGPNIATDFCKTEKLARKLTSAIAYLLQCFKVSIDKNIVYVALHVLNRECHSQFGFLSLCCRNNLLQKIFQSFSNVGKQDTFDFHEPDELKREQKNLLFIAYILSISGKMHFQKVLNKFTEFNIDLPRGMLNDSDKFRYFRNLNGCTIGNDGYVKLTSFPPPEMQSVTFIGSGTQSQIRSTVLPGRGTDKQCSFAQKIHYSKSVIDKRTNVDAKMNKQPLGKYEDRKDMANRAENEKQIVHSGLNKNTFYNVCERIIHGIGYLLNYFDPVAICDVISLVLYVLSDVKNFFLNSTNARQKEIIRVCIFCFDVNHENLISKSFQSSTVLNLNGEEKDVLFIAYLLLKEDMLYGDLFVKFAEYGRKLPELVHSLSDQYKYFKERKSFFILEEKGFVKLHPLPIFNRDLVNAACNSDKSESFVEEEKKKVNHTTECIVKQISLNTNSSDSKSRKRSRSNKKASLASFFDPKPAVTIQNVGSESKDICIPQKDVSLRQPSIPPGFKNLEPLIPPDLQQDSYKLYCDNLIDSCLADLDTNESSSDEVTLNCPSAKRSNYVCDRTDSTNSFPKQKLPSKAEKFYDYSSHKDPVKEIRTVNFFTILLGMYKAGVSPNMLLTHLQSASEEIQTYLKDCYEGDILSFFLSHPTLFFISPSGNVYLKWQQR